MNFQLFAKFYTWFFSALKRQRQLEKPVRTELPIVKREWENQEKCQFEPPAVKREWENREWQP